MTSLLAIDISGHQTTTPSLTVFGSAFVKATEGTGFIDPMYATHTAHALGQGKYLASYHFAISTADIDAQAQWYLGHTAGAQALVIDNEDRWAVINGIRKLISPKMTRTDCRRLIAAVKARDPRHRECGLYMNQSDYIAGGYADCGQDFDWIARWGSTPPATHWDVWQYSSTPQGTLDLDRFASQAVLDRVFQVPPDSSTVTPAPHFNAVVTTPTNLYNPVTRKWVYNGKNVIKVGTKLVIRGVQQSKGGVRCYPVVSPSLYAGDCVPVAHVKLGAKVP